MLFGKLIVIHLQNTAVFGSHVQIEPLANF